MSGGVVQLVATGIQDAHLTGNPEISFFRSSYKRHTHFAMSVEEQLIQGNPGPKGVSTVRFEKKGDLLSYVYFTARTSAGAATSVNWATAIDKVELVIGGQVIDTQDVYFSNTLAPMMLSSTFSTKFRGGDGGSTAIFPLQFFFCKDFNSALPLVALQFHDVEIRITWNAPVTDGTIVYRCWSNFIYLDKMEREHFASKAQDIIMYQVQRMIVSEKYQQELPFNHPVKFIAFPVKAYTASKQKLRYQINGVDIGNDRALPHWTQATLYYHTQFGYDTAAPQTALIPFCLDTSKLQPTGTLNFSRIDTFKLLTDNSLGLSTDIVDTAQSGFIYAVNYNVLRINQGMGALLYSN
jgi:hypothetical protein